MSILILGIDPGLSGAVGEIQPGGKTKTFDTPTYKVQVGNKKTKRSQYNQLEMAKILVKAKKRAESNGWELTVYIEKQSARPAMGGDKCKVCGMNKKILRGVTSSFTTGYGYACWITILKIYRIPFVEVTPQAWKKDIFKGQKTYGDKTASIRMAEQLMPDCDIYGPRGGGKDGRAEALLIAYYGRKDVGMQPIEPPPMNQQESLSF